MRHEGNRTDDNWTRALTDLEGALANGNLLVQASVFPNALDSNMTASYGLLNVTASGLAGIVQMPYNYTNGSAVYLGDPGLGYPPALYPNLTYGAPTASGAATVSYDGTELMPNDTLLLGPLIVNETYALLSATVAMINNTSRSDILGWLTVVIDMSTLYNIQNSPEGLGDSGQVLLVGPARRDNRFSRQIRGATPEFASRQEVQFILPPQSNSTLSNRHQERSSLQDSTIPFPMSAYPAVVSAWTQDNHAINNAGAYISTHNEENITVSVGYAVLSTQYLDWVLLVELSHSEVVMPINHLRDVVLICVFSVMGLLLLVTFPMAHYSITPIRQLRAATAKTIEPYQPEEGSEYESAIGNATTEDESGEDVIHVEKGPKDGFLGTITKWSHLKKDGGDRPSTPRRLRRRTFRIPSKVPEHRHCITDELTELTKTFNEMTDELAMQYERLEERVKERTAELEKSKKAAEAANESKTLFIANISHELKTPLNGILGLTTVCMNEDDIHKIRSTLSTIYKLGDLLLHLLTDVLMFSKNEVGQQLSIDEAEFRLSDLSTQLIPTFEKQAREAQVELKILYLGTNDAFGDSSDSAEEKLYGPAGTGRVRDMCLWGDKNRILQVLMNFVSNSLKFTPAHGSVIVRIRCVGLAEKFPSRSASARKSSLNSRKPRSVSSKKIRTSDASLVPSKGAGDSEPSDHLDRSHSHSHLMEDPKLSINVAGGTAHIAKIAERRRSMSPAPLNTKDLTFDFEVEDTGPGIPPEQQKKIFEPFVQGDLGLSKKYGGTGLGLSICTQLADLMGGDISLDSKVGVGSKFTMRLPLRYVAEHTPSIASSAPRSHSKPSSFVGQTLHDHPDVALQNHADSTTSPGSGRDETTTSPKLADVPRIVGFTQPYVAKEGTTTSSEAKLNEMKKVESEAAEKGRKVRVLVAEDNKVNQEVVLRMLRLEDVYGE